MTDDTDTPNPMRDRLLDAAMSHVAFDGWSPATFAAACADAGIDPALAAAACPRGAVDLAVALHRRGDAEMLRRLRVEPLSDLRFREKVARAVRLRIEAIPDREAVRRASTLFSLPHLAPDGARLIWGTADAIWTALGDTSDDLNWYTKRATLAGVYAATVLFWLGDDSADHQATWAFLDRRIEDVMRIEQVKAAARKNPLLRPAMLVQDWVAARVRPPARMPQVDLPAMLSGRAPTQGGPGAP
jgi:ubiquinone biosynthesis protein COQ9